MGTHPVLIACVVVMTTIVRVRSSSTRQQTTTVTGADSTTVINGSFLFSTSQPGAVTGVALKSRIGLTAYPPPVTNRFQREDNGTIIFEGYQLPEDPTSRAAPILLYSHNLTVGSWYDGSGGRVNPASICPRVYVHHDKESGEEYAVAFFVTSALGWNVRSGELLWNRTVFKYLDIQLAICPAVDEEKGVAYIQWDNEQDFHYNISATSMKSGEIVWGHFNPAREFDNFGATKLLLSPDKSILIDGGVASQSSSSTTIGLATSDGAWLWNNSFVATNYITSCGSNFFHLEQLSNVVQGFDFTTGNSTLWSSGQHLPYYYGCNAQVLCGSKETCEAMGLSSSGLFVHFCVWACQGHDGCWGSYIQPVDCGNGQALSWSLTFNHTWANSSFMPLWTGTVSFVPGVGLAVRTNTSKIAVYDIFTGHLQALVDDPQGVFDRIPSSPDAVQVLRDEPGSCSGEGGVKSSTKVTGLSVLVQLNAYYGGGPVRLPVTFYLGEGSDDEAIAHRSTPGQRIAPVSSLVLSNQAMRTNRYYSSYIDNLTPEWIYSPDDGTAACSSSGGKGWWVGNGPGLFNTPWPSFSPLNSSAMSAKAILMELLRLGIPEAKKKKSGPGTVSSSNKSSTNCKDEWNWRIPKSIYNYEIQNIVTCDDGDGGVFILTNFEQGTLTRLDACTGHQVWSKGVSYAQDSHDGPTRLWYYQGQVLVLHLTLGIVAYDAKNGSSLWSAGYNDQGLPLTAASFYRYGGADGAGRGTMTLLQVHKYQGDGPSSLFIINCSAAAVSEHRVLYSGSIPQSSDASIIGKGRDGESVVIKASGGMQEFLSMKTGKKLGETHVDYNPLTSGGYSYLQTRVYPCSDQIVLVRFRIITGNYHFRFKVAALDFDNFKEVWSFESEDDPSFDVNTYPGDKSKKIDGIYTLMTRSGISAYKCEQSPQSVLSQPAVWTTQFVQEHLVPQDQGNSLYQFPVLILSAMEENKKNKNEVPRPKYGILLYSGGQSPSYGAGSVFDMANGELISSFNCTDGLLRPGSDGVIQRPLKIPFAAYSHKTGKFALTGSRSSSLTSTTSKFKFVDLLSGKCSSVPDSDGRGTADSESLPYSMTMTSDSGEDFAILWGKEHVAARRFQS